MFKKCTKVSEVKLNQVYVEEPNEDKHILKGISAWIISVVAITMALFHLYTAGFGVMVATSQRGIHLTFLLILCFLLYPATKDAPKDKISKVDIILVFLSLFVTLYPVVFQERIQQMAHLPISTIEYISGWIFILLVLEATRRVVGKQLTIVAVICLLYCKFGYLIPGDFGHSGFSWKRIVRHMYLTQEGIFGIALGVSATYIVLFIIFGAFLDISGMAKLFCDLSMAVAGKGHGGPAKVAVIASCLLGMINGSAPANVVTTGSFTIPLMKKVGYDPPFAAAVEAVASTGGQIMPPIMGAVAFIMADFLQIPYWKVAMSAFIPGILYYCSCLATVHLRAVKKGLKGISNNEFPKAKDALLARGHLIISIILLTFLLIKGYTPMFAAFYSIVSLLLISQIRGNTRLTLKSIYCALEKSAYSTLSVGIACAVVGIIVGTASLTSIGMVFGDKIMSIGHESIPLALLLTAMATMILGMGVPTVAAYVIVSLISIPTLLKLGIAPLIAHMFALYFAVLATITPPVALSSYAAAAIAGSNPTRTGWVALKLAIPGFVIPFLFVYSPELLLIGTKSQIIWAFITTLLCVLSLSAAIEGFLFRSTTAFERIILIIGVVFVIVPRLYCDFIGIIFIMSVLLSQRLKPKNLIASSKTQT